MRMTIFSFLLSVYLFLPFHLADEGYQPKEIVFATQIWISAHRLNTSDVNSLYLGKARKNRDHGFHGVIHGF